MRALVLAGLFVAGGLALPDEPVYDKAVKLRGVDKDGKELFVTKDIPARFIEKGDKTWWHVQAAVKTGRYPKKGYVIIDPDGVEWLIVRAESSTNGVDVCFVTKIEKPKKKD